MVLNINPYKPGVLFMEHRQTEFTKRGVPSGDILFADNNFCQRKAKYKWKITPDSPKNENGLIQMIRMEKFIRHNWVKTLA